MVGSIPHYLILSHVKKLFKQLVVRVQPFLQWLILVVTDDGFWAGDRDTSAIPLVSEDRTGYFWMRCDGHDGDNFIVHPRTGSQLPPLQCLWFTSVVVSDNVICLHVMILCISYLAFSPGFFSVAGNSFQSLCAVPHPYIISFSRSSRSRKLVK